MQLSKTDFIQFLSCPKSLWLLKHEPDAYPQGEFSAFLQKLTREGYEVERYVRQHLEGGRGRKVNFQAIVEAADGLYARIDVLESTAAGETILYEVKSSTSVKTDRTHNHLKDACFQKICAERAGRAIDRVVLVHLDRAYVRAGGIDPAGLLMFADVTDDVETIERETAREIDEALALLGTTSIDRNGCSCLHNSRANHCDSFAVFNPTVPTPSIYSLPRLSQNKRDELVAGGTFDLAAIPDDFDLSANQLVVAHSAKAGAPQINRDGIRAFLDRLQFPLHFFDFETYASAVPLIDGTRPHAHFPVQYSLHVIEADDSIEHREYLEREARLPDRLLARMQEDIGPVGSLVSWHATFEKTRIRELAERYPKAATFLNHLNDRMVDLEDVFKSDYVDAAFDGSTSIKKVLPVVCPELDYKDLEVQDGTSAMNAWAEMIAADAVGSGAIAQALLRYCERDTYAMVEIHRFLQKVAASGKA